MKEAIKRNFQMVFPPKKLFSKGGNNKEFKVEKKDHVERFCIVLFFKVSFRLEFLKIKWKMKDAVKISFWVVISLWKKYLQT